MQNSINSELINGLKLRPEEQFIINCLRSEFGGESNDEFVNFDLSNIDWNVVYEKSIHWGVALLLYKIIKRQSSLPQFSRTSGNSLQKITIAYLRTFTINKTNFKKLVEILKAFNTAGIKVILLKGSHLAQFVYQDAGLRPMTDIDILVKKEDLHKIEESLLQMGYHYIKKAHGIDWYKTNHLHISFTHPKGIKNLEVHWTIIRPSLPLNIDIEGLWKRAKDEKINGTDVLVLSPEDSLLHLSLHTSYDIRFRSDLRPYCDIAAIVNRYTNEIDWNQLQIRAHEWGTEKCLYLTLRLSQDILGLSLPGSVLNTLKPVPFSEKIVLETQKRIFPTGIMKPTVALINHPETFFQDISLSRKISYIFHRIFIHPQELAVHYSLPVSSKRVYFYYFVRFISLLYRKTPLYAKFFLYLLTHKKANFYNYNLDTWLMPSDSEKSKPR